MSNTHIPLGTRCSAAFILRDNLGVRKQSLPFDWIDLPVKNLIQFIDLDGLSVEGFMDRYFSEVVMNKQGHPDGTTFPHDIYRHEDMDDSEVIKKTKEKYLKRLIRLHGILNSEQPLVFLTAIEKYNEENISHFNQLRDYLLKQNPNSFFITANLYHEDCKFDHGYNFFLRKEVEDLNYKIWEFELGKLILETEDTKKFFDLESPLGIQGHCEDLEN